MKFIKYKNELNTIKMREDQVHVITQYQYQNQTPFRFLTEDTVVFHCHTVILIPF